VELRLKKAGDTRDFSGVGSTVSQWKRFVDHDMSAILATSQGVPSRMFQYMTDVAAHIVQYAVSDPTSTAYSLHKRLIPLFYCFFSEVRH